MQTRECKFLLITGPPMFGLQAMPTAAAEAAAAATAKIQALDAVASNLGLVSSFVLLMQMLLFPFLISKIKYDENKI